MGGLTDGDPQVRVAQAALRWRRSRGCELAGKEKMSMTQTRQKQIAGRRVGGKVPVVVDSDIW